MQSGSTPDVKDYFSDLNTPNPADMQLQLEELVQQGSLSPEQARAILLERSSMEDVTQDAATRQAQMEALGQLQDITSSGGLTSTDRSKLNQIFSEQDTKNRGAREAILQSMEARGAGGSGASLLAQLQAQQDAATTANARGLDVAAQAEQRALDALVQQGNLATTVGNQQFQQDAQKAGAKDAIAQFNAQNQQQVGLVNTAANNDAAAKNLAAKQSISDSNTATRNQQQQYNKNLIQQNFENELKKRGGQTQVAQANAQAQGQNSQNQANAFNQTVGTGLSAAAMFMSDEREKENIEDFDASAFLDSLTGKKYNYKNQKHGKGQQAGVMAQDLLKTPEGSSAVQETDEGMMVDAGKASNLALASLANLNKRIKDLEGEDT